MAFKKNNKNTKNFYTNKSYNTVPDLPAAKVTPSTFPKQPEYTAKNITTPWQSYRNFDATANKIDVNITGYAPLFGSETNSTSYDLGQDVGLFNGAFNDIYNSGHFSLLATIMRDISINYWGLNFTDISANPKPESKLADKAFTTWERNTNTLLSILRQAMYTDLRFFNYGYQIDRPSTINSSTNFIESNYTKVLSPQSYMLLAYQHQIQEVLITMLNFEMLTAQLPLLQEIYKDKTDFITQIQNQLKRSQYTSQVKSVLTWLKRRFVDKNYFKNFILPTSVVSKETDGLNSPIIYLRHNTFFPIEPICYINPNTSKVEDGSYTVPIQFFRPGDYKFEGTHGELSDIQNVNTLQYKGGINHNVLDAFNINTILDILLDSKDLTTFSARIKTWFKTAQDVLAQLNTNVLDISSRDWFRDVEAALQKLASQPSGINWEQNVETSAINGMFKYANYELVNDLAVAAVSKPVWNDNGYTIRVPMFRKSGLSNILIKEHAQAFYLPSDDKSMSFIRLGDTIAFTTRQNRRIDGIFTEDTVHPYEIPTIALWKVKLTFDANNNPVYTKEDATILDTDAQIYLVFQDKFAKIVDTGTPPVYWTNSELIQIVPIMFQNRWADYVKLATTNYIIPLA